MWEDKEYGLEFFQTMSKVGVVGFIVDKSMAYRLFWDLVKSDVWAEKIRKVEDLHKITIYGCQIILAWVE